LELTVSSRSHFSKRNEEQFSPGTRFSFFVGEAFRRIWVSRRSSSVAILMIALALSIVGMFLLVSENLRGAIEQIGASSRMTIYLDANAGESEINAVRSVLSKQQGFEKQRLVSRAEALARFRSYFASLAPVVDDLGSNPFPVSFEIELTRATIESPSFNRKVKDLRSVTAVDTIEYDWEWTQRLRRIVNLIDTTGLVIGGVLAIAASFMIANVIRLTMLLYREEIEIMRLVGATERTIRGPFLIEGVLQGLVGGIVAVGILMLAHWLLIRQIPAEASLVLDTLFRRPLSADKLASLVAGGVLAGLLGSWLSLRDYKQSS